MKLTVINKHISVATLVGILKKSIGPGSLLLSPEGLALVAAVTASLVRLVVVQAFGGSSLPLAGPIELAKSKATTAPTASSLVSIVDANTVAYFNAKTFEYLQIQSLVNLITTSYGLTIKTVPASTRDKYAIECGEVCGFFRPDEVTSKDHMNAHLQQWLPKLLQPTFGAYMAALFILFARTYYPPAPKDGVLRANYKWAKSALENKRFSKFGETILRKIVNMLVELDE